LAGLKGGPKVDVKVGYKVVSWAGEKEEKSESFGVL